ncbi:MAG: methyltransferase domain-containing protein [Caldilineaceae bacterium]
MNNAQADQLNHDLVQKLTQLNHIKSDAVAAAFLATPRYFFVPDAALAEAYENRALPLKQQGEAWVSSISQPSMIAIMLEQLEMRPGMKVLEIGAGSGYNAALMAYLVGEDGRVITLDIDQDLVDGARANLAAAGVANVTAVCADGGLGYAASAPYDRIILTVEAADISPHWVAQLAPGGRLLLPLEVAMRQLAVAFDRVDDADGTHLESHSVQECAFIRLRGAYAAHDVAPLELTPGVELFTPRDDLRAAAGQILVWLQQPPRDWPTGVEITRGAFWRGLALWLTLHEPAMAGLRATGQAIRSGQIPLLHLFAEEVSIVTAAILCGQHGIAALVRAHPILAANDEASDPQPFELVVRQFGVDEAAARRLVALVQAWESAGRPAVDGMRLAAYPKNMEPPETDGFLVEKPECWLVVEWGEAAATATHG